MAFIQGLLGGNSFKAQGATQDQANNASAQTQDAIAKQRAFVDATNAANGLGNQSDVYNKLNGIVSGAGPNPAQAMLANATGANVANTAANIAGARGAGANAGLVARNAANAGAGIQQNAVGQGATLQANQSLNALGQQGNIAGQQVAQQASALQGLNASTNQQQGNVLNSLSNQNQTNEKASEQNAGGLGGLLGGVGTALLGPLGSVVGGGLADAAKGIFGGGSGGSAPAPGAAPTLGANLDIGPAPKFAGGGAVQPRTHVGAHLMKRGGPVPGKPAVGGATNSYANDVVPARLSPGEVVIPRSVTMSSDPAGNAAKFVAAIMAKKGLGR